MIISSFYGGRGGSHAFEITFLLYRSNYCNCKKAKKTKHNDSCPVKDLVIKYDKCFRLNPQCWTRKGYSNAVLKGRKTFLRMFSNNMQISY
jgi:hypothetical protein